MYQIAKNIHFLHNYTLIISELQSRSQHVFVYGCACMCLCEPKKKHAWEVAQRGERGVELCEVSDTVAVTAALNVPLISHQSLLQSLEGDKKLLPTVQSPTLSSAWVQSNHPFRAWNIRWPQRKFNIHAPQRGVLYVSIQCGICMYTKVYSMYCTVAMFVLLGLSREGK